jgi:hypothetical protein
MLEKKDQDLYEILLNEYNNCDVKQYGESAFPRVRTSETLGLSKTFEQVSSWDEMRTPYQDLLNRYVDVQSNVQLSETHDDGEEILIDKFSPKTSQTKHSSQDMTMIPKYSKAIAAGVEVRKHELAVQQENMLGTTRMNESTEKLDV